MMGSEEEKEEKESGSSFCDPMLAGCLCVSLAIWWLGGGSRGSG